MDTNYLAQQVTIGGQTIKGPVVGINNLGDLVSRVVNVFLIPLAAIILFIVLLWGGISFITSRGNPEKVKSAKAKLTTGIIGFVLLILSYLIVKLISVSIFGLGKGLF